MANPILQVFSDPWLLYPAVRWLIGFIGIVITGFFLASQAGVLPPELAIIYSIIRVVFIFLIMLLFFVGLFAGVELFYMRPKFVHDPRKPSKGHKPRSAGPSQWDAWQKIRAKAEAGSPEGIRVAIIEADGFVDNVLKARHYSGETFADRLAQIKPHSMETLDRLWDAHRLRNDIVHTQGFEVSADTARIALNNYEAFLHELGALTPPIASALQHKEKEEEEEEGHKPGAFDDD